MYHSPIAFNFEKRYIKKGYPELLILGDTRTGKTQAAEMMLSHYGLGITAQAEAMSYAGLVGGLQQVLQKKWDITWGKLPQNNRRLVIIDEATGLDEETIGKLSSIRSSGEATIEKIQSQRTEAKTRILWLSNPRERRMVAEFSSGISCLHSLTKQPEDIARWDMVVLVAKDDVDLKTLNWRTRKRVQHTHEARLCHDLILWCWTRKPNQIILSEETEDACTSYGTKLIERYTDDFPLLSQGEQRIKMAKLAVSLAGRLFSTEDGVNLIVRPEHVEYIFNWMCSVFDSKAFRYNKWSESREFDHNIIDVAPVQRFMDRLTRVGCIKFKALEKVQLRDIEEYMGIPTDEARAHLSQLLQNNALKRLHAQYYGKTSQFDTMLEAFISGNHKIKEEF